MINTENGNITIFVHRDWSLYHRAGADGASLPRKVYYSPEKMKRMWTLFGNFILMLFRGCLSLCDELSTIQGLCISKRFSFFLFWFAKFYSHSKKAPYWILQKRHHTEQGFVISAARSWFGRIPSIHSCLLWLLILLILFAMLSGIPCTCRWFVSVRKSWTGSKKLYMEQGRWVELEVFLPLCESGALSRNRCSVTSLIFRAEQ